MNNDPMKNLCLHLSGTRRHAIAAIGNTLALPLWAQSANAWSGIETKARGQSVYFNAWAGSERINSYLQWAGAEVERSCQSDAFRSESQASDLALHGWRDDSFGHI